MVRGDDVMEIWDLVDEVFFILKMRKLCGGVGIAL